MLNFDCSFICLEFDNMIKLFFFLLRDYIIFKFGKYEIYVIYINYCN